MKKTLIITCEIIVLLAIMAGFWFFWKGCIRLTGDKGLSRSVKQQLYDSTAHYRDLYNREHATRMLIEADRASIELLYGRQLDSIAKAIGTPKKNIQAVTGLGTQTAASIVAMVKDTVYLDTNKTTHEIRYSDKWLWMQGKIGTQALINYIIYDSLIITTHSKRKNLFAPKEIFIDAYSLNPHTRINSITGFRVATYSPKRLGIGLHVGYGYNGVQWAPNISIGLNYSIFYIL